MKTIQVLLTILFLLSISVYGQQTVKFEEAIGSGTEEISSFSKWNFAIGSNNFEISNNGKGKRVKSKNAVSSFRFPLGKGEMISSRIYFAQYKTNLIFLYEASVGGDGLGHIASFNSTTLKPKWTAKISGFNIGQGLIENQYAYLTAIGFVAKINLTNGKYVWKHDNLYSWNQKRGAFNAFELPELEGNNVIFTENTNYNQTNIIVVNKDNGKIIRTVLADK